MDSRVCPNDGFQTVDEAVIKGANDPRVGKVFEGRYRIDDVLGRGGMGTVYRATQLAVGRPVAIKTLNADRVGDLTTIARFQQEARSVAALRHPNTIRLIDFGHAEDGTLFLVMEYLEGEPLSHLIKREAPLDAERVIRIARQILESLAEAHNVGIIHRDLKPDNLFVTELFGRVDFVKILDFGIAKVSGFGPDPTLTGAGIALGSPRYISPEQASAGSIDARTDIYALGVVLYEMLTGAPPFVCESVAQYMLAHVEEEAPPLRIRGQVVRGQLPDIILRCLSKHPTHRPRSATELIGFLQDCQDDPFGASAQATTAVVPRAGHDGGGESAQGTDAKGAAPLPQTIVEAGAAPEPAEGWPGVRGHAGSPEASPKASQTGLAPRAYHAVPPPPLQSSVPSALPLALAAVLLFGLGGGGAWWMLQSEEAAPDTAPSAAPPSPRSASEASRDERASEASVPAADDPMEAEEDEAPPPSDGVVMLVTVPAGATVKRGQVILGTTPFALVWGGEQGGRPLRVELEGYQTERVRRADVGGSARYELYLRPKGASKARRSRRSGLAKDDGSWVSKISKPTRVKKPRRRPSEATPRSRGGAGAARAKQPPPSKAPVYEELD